MKQFKDLKQGQFIIVILKDGTFGVAEVMKTYRDLSDHLHIKINVHTKDPALNVYTMTIDHESEYVYRDYNYEYKCYSDLEWFRKLMWERVDHLLDSRDFNRVAQVYSEIIEKDELIESCLNGTNLW